MDANQVLQQFKFTRLLNSDQGGRRIILQGTIASEPALLLAERGAFSTDDRYLHSFADLLSNVQNLGDNDIYRWYLANTRSARDDDDDDDGGHDGQPAAPPDLKLNLIYPSTDKHARKYAFQQARAVVETPEIYARYVRPYMAQCRAEGRLNWIFNILEGRTEQADVLYRSAPVEAWAAPSAGDDSSTSHTSTGTGPDDFLLLPDLNWDRRTAGALHLLALVARRDVWSVRDLRRRDAAWLRRLRATLAATVARLFPAVEPDMLKFYVHYQPTYYHFHIHVVHVSLEATATQAVGKALGLEHVVSQLETLAGGSDDDDAGMHQVELAYTLGEASELWTRIFAPLKEGREPDVGG